MTWESCSPTSNRGIAFGVYRVGSAASAADATKDTVSGGGDGDRDIVLRGRVCSSDTPLERVPVSRYHAACYGLGWCATPTKFSAAKGGWRAAGLHPGRFVFTGAFYRRMTSANPICFIGCVYSRAGCRVK